MVTSSSDFQTAVIPLIAFIVGFLVFSLLVFVFGNHLGTKNVIHTNIPEFAKRYHGAVQVAIKVFFFFLESLIIAPIFIVLWLFIMTGTMVVLSHNSPQSILLASFAIVAVIRIIAYINEKMSIELAKLVPFTLVGYALADLSYFSYDIMREDVNGMLSMWNIVLYYIVFVVGLEILLRFAHLILHLIIEHRSYPYSSGEETSFHEEPEHKEIKKTNKKKGKD